MSKVMLIEDDATMLSLLKSLLEIEGYQVVQYQWDIDPLEPIREEKPDVILLDVHLKNFNGLELLRSLRGDEALRAIRVIMSSGKDVRDACLEAGADDFLLKPFMPDDLLQRISNNKRAV